LKFRFSIQKIRPVWERCRRALPLALAVFTATLVLNGSWFRWAETYELQSYDWRFGLNPAQTSANDIVIIEIGEETMRNLGSFPFERDYHGVMLEILRIYGARLAVFDVLFSEPSEEDEYFSQKAAEFGKTLFCEAIERPEIKKDRSWGGAGIFTGLLDIFRPSAAGVGHVNIIVDRDGARRRVVPVIEADGKRYFHLGLLAAMKYLDVDESEVKQDSRGRIHLGKKVVIPTGEDGQTLIYFKGKWHKVYRHLEYYGLLYAYRKVLHGGEPEPVLLDLKGKVCFIGLTATGTHDIGPVPVDNLYPQIGIHVDFFDNILNQRFMTRASRAMNLLILIALILAAAAVSRIPRLWLSVAAALVLWCAFFALNLGAFRFGRLWADLFYPSLVYGIIYSSAIFWRTLSEMRKRELIENELSIASRIQRSFLPATLPESDLMEIAVHMQPAKHVGGDLYSVFRMDAERLGIMCGDVSGKGMPAALFMAKCVSEFRFHASAANDPAVTLRALNDGISENESSGLFVTMNYLIVNTHLRILTMTNGGHMPVLKVGADGEVKHLDSEGGMPIGLMPGVDFGNTSVDLRPGDVFVMYTDGISEARNRKTEDYEIERLRRAVTVNRGSGAEEIKDRVLADVQDFVKTAPQHDDMTLIVLKVKS